MESANGTDGVLDCVRIIRILYVTHKHLTFQKSVTGQYTIRECRRRLVCFLLRTWRFREYIRMRRFRFVPPPKLVLTLAKVARLCFLIIDDSIKLRISSNNGGDTNDES